MRQLHIDAFVTAAGAFTGNPAAVVDVSSGHAVAPDAEVTAGFPSEAWMQALANDNNLAETAFVSARGDGSFALRWFTPTTEVDLCGHATLAAAHALWHTGTVPDCTPEIHFRSRSGSLRARRTDDGRIQLNFPATPPAPLAAAEEAKLREQLPELLGIRADQAVFAGRSRFDVLVHVTPEAFAGLRPNMGAIEAVAGRGLIVTAVGGAASDARTAPHAFVSRFFAPQSGVPEDPVTGSAHCALAPYWASHFAARLAETPALAATRSGLDIGGDGKISGLRAFQASRRGGEVHCSIVQEAGASSCVGAGSSGSSIAAGAAGAGGACVDGAIGNRVLLAGRALVVYESVLAACALPPK
jgi:PhzF family phenazine biosynthesis protein